MSTLKDLRQASHNNAELRELFRSEIAPCEKSSIDGIEVEVDMDIWSKLSIPKVVAHFNGPKQGPNDCSVFAQVGMSILLYNLADGSTKCVGIAVLEEKDNASTNSSMWYF